MTHTLLTAPPCPFCGQTAHPGRRASQIRRGDRVLSVEAMHWECVHGCLDEDGITPFRFEDPPLMRANDQAVSAAWKARFGEALPPAGRPGRKPVDPRNVRVQVMFTASEVEAIDRERGSTPRSELIRQRVLRAG